MNENYVKEFKLKKENKKISFVSFTKYEQIAYAMRPMIFACIEAYNITGNVKYAEQAAELGMWFFGSNPPQIDMYVPETGMVFDGIGSVSSYNENSGAESTIEGLLAIQAIENCPAAENYFNSFRSTSTE